MTEHPESLSILGTQVHNFHSHDEVLSLIQRRISCRRQTFCVAINPEKVYRAKRDLRLGRVLASADIRICDGVGISLASMLLYHRWLARCTGVDLFLKLVRLSAEEGWAVFLLGASPVSNEAACRALQKAFPALRVAGRQHGYFEDSAAVIEEINDSGADLLFVAMGSPRQEFWISQHLSRLKPTVCMGIGGSLDVVSGAAKRAPALFRNTGTEWLFRLAAQPGRFRRQTVLPLYALAILRSALARVETLGLARSGSLRS